MINCYSPIHFLPLVGNISTKIPWDAFRTDVKMRRIVPENGPTQTDSGHNSFLRKLLWNIIVTKCTLLVSKVQSMTSFLGDKYSHSFVRLPQTSRPGLGTAFRDTKMPQYWSGGVKMLGKPGVLEWPLQHELSCWVGVNKILTVQR